MIKSPFDYAGFVGDGIADDTVPLQAALDDTSCSWLDFTDVVGAKHTDTLVMSAPKLLTGVKGRSALKFVQASAGAPKAALRVASGAAGAEVKGLKSDYQFGASVTAGSVGAWSLEAENVLVENIEADAHKGTAPTGVLITGIETRASRLRLIRPKIRNVSGYGIRGLAMSSLGWPAELSDILVEDPDVSLFGAYGICFQNQGAMSKIKLLLGSVDMSDHATSSMMNAVFIGSSPSVAGYAITEDVLVQGVSVRATSRPDNSANGSITLWNTISGRVIGCSTRGGGIGISMAYGYNNVEVGNVIDGPEYYGIEMAGGYQGCFGNAIEGRGWTQKGVAIQCAAPIYNVNAGPNNIQSCVARIYQQSGHPGPFRISDPS